MQGTEMFVNAQTSSGRAREEPPNVASREGTGCWRTRERCCLTFTITHGRATPSSESYPQVMIQNKNTIKKKKNKNSPSDGLQDWIRLGHVDTSQGKFWNAGFCHHSAVFPLPRKLRGKSVDTLLSFLNCRQVSIQNFWKGLFPALWWLSNTYQDRG